MVLRTRLRYCKTTPSASQGGQAGQEYFRVLYYLGEFRRPLEARLIERPMRKLRKLEVEGDSGPDCPSDSMNRHVRKCVCVFGAKLVPFLSFPQHLVSLFHSPPCQIWTRSWRIRGSLLFRSYHSLTPAFAAERKTERT